jgi:hypothetical protein
MTVLAKPGGPTADLDSGLPSSNEEILEALRLGEEDAKAGRRAPILGTIEKMRRAIAGQKKIQGGGH